MFCIYSFNSTNTLCVFMGWVYKNYRDGDKVSPGEVIIAWICSFRFLHVAKYIFIHFLTRPCQFSIKSGVYFPALGVRMGLCDSLDKQDTAELIMPISGG